MIYIIINKHCALLLVSAMFISSSPYPTSYNIHVRCHHHQHGYFQGDNHIVPAVCPGVGARRSSWVSGAQSVLLRGGVPAVDPALLASMETVT